MSIADHFEHAPDAVFVRNYDAGTARRQFNVSLILIAIIAIAATALGYLVRFDAPTMQPTVSSAVSAPPAYAGKI